MKNISNVRVICVFICLFIIFLGAASYIVRIGTRTFISLTGKTNGFTAWLFKDQPTLNNQAENKPSLKMPEIVDWVSMYPFSEETLKKAVYECLETDTNIKSGKIDGETAVELIIAKYSV